MGDSSTKSTQNLNSRNLTCLFRASGKVKSKNRVKKSINTMRDIFSGATVGVRLRENKINFAASKINKGYRISKFSVLLWEGSPKFKTGKRSNQRGQEFKNAAKIKSTTRNQQKSAITASTSGLARSRKENPKMAQSFENMDEEMLDLSGDAHRKPQNSKQEAAVPDVKDAEDANNNS